MYHTCLGVNGRLTVRLDASFLSIQIVNDCFASGLHSSNDAFRLRLCYLLYRFLKECRTDIPPDMCATIANSFRDLLLIVPKLPDPEEVETDMLTDAVKDATFDSQLYLYETIGILCSIMFKSPQEESELLMSFVQPLMDDLSSSLTAYSQNSQDALHVVKTRHIIMALGNVAKGFPDYPQPPVPEGYILPPVNVFGEIGQAILVCLQAMNVYRVVRDAVSTLRDIAHSNHILTFRRLALLLHESWPQLARLSLISSPHSCLICLSTLILQS